ncbi:LysE family transporter [Metabacillus sp. RGM 3146]|uniref:LysE family transporter n=1 Tax=Metabacillus sp. RGM 3146 TaxID=3401092 RepID=UPI003B997900
MLTLLNYVLLGISLAAPIGPINAAQLDKGMKNGFWHSWLIGLGATTADLVYMVLVYIGIVQFIDLPLIKIFLYSFGAFVLIYSGIEGLLSMKKAISSLNRKSEPKWKCYFSGFLMSLTNPLTILFWIGIYGSVLANMAGSAGTVELYIISAAIFAGILAWDFSMAILSSVFRRYTNGKFLKLTSLISGLTLIGFGLYFACKACALLF